MMSVETIAWCTPSRLSMAQYILLDVMKRLHYSMTHYMPMVDVMRMRINRYTPHKIALETAR